jgi:hypothetical protein
MTKLEVLAKLAKGLITEEAASELLEQVELAKKPITVKATADGKPKISLYGTQTRFPVTQWVGQWKRILEGVGPVDAAFPVGKIQALIAEFDAAEAEAAAKAKAEAEAAAKVTDAAA